MIAHLDDVALPHILIDAIHDLVPFDKSLITLEKKKQIPVHIFDSGIDPEEHELHVTRYISGAYLLDPVYQALFRGIEPGFYHLRELSPDDFEQSEYYRTYYQATRIAEDVLYLVRLDEGTSLYIELGRDLDKPPYTEQEKNHLRMVEPIVQNVARRYWGHMNTENTAFDASMSDLDQQLEMAFDNFGKSILTKREIELTHLMLRGHSVKSAAYEMRISPDTVKMHRKNLYAKLKISDHPDLFALFISVLSCVDQSPDKDPLVTYLGSH
ncbi:MAG: helix-turn-helix transcriptional regulator [Thermodesulfobacteriota bacterium]